METEGYSGCLQWTIQSIYTVRLDCGSTDLLIIIFHRVFNKVSPNGEYLGTVDSKGNYNGLRGMLQREVSQ